MKNLAIAILGLFLALPVHAQTMDGQAPVSASYVDFSGGLNDYQAPMYIAKNESPDLMNVVIDEPLGTLAQRKGYLTCGNTPSGNTATNLYNWTRNDGSQNLIVTDNISVWQTSDCNTYVLISTGLSALALPHFATVQDKLWIVNGSTYPIVWDGSTAKSLDGTSNKPLAPRAKYMVYWKSRIFFANTPTDPSAVQFTQLTDDDGNVLDPSVSTSAYNSLNVLYINRGDGSPIYGLHLYKDNLYVFKETGVNRIVFESEYNVQIGKNVTTVGCKFNDAIVEMDDGLLRYPGRDGLYAFNGVTASKVSTKWTTAYYSMKQPTHNELYKLWDTDSDFLTGTLVNVSTSIKSGSISLNPTAPYSGDVFVATITRVNNVSCHSISTNTINSITLKYYGGSCNSQYSVWYSTTPHSYYSTFGVVPSTSEWRAWTSYVTYGGDAYPHSILEWWFNSDSISTTSVNGYSIKWDTDNRRVTINKWVSGTKTSLGSFTRASFPSYSANPFDKPYWRIVKSTHNVFQIYDSATSNYATSNLLFTTSDIGTPITPTNVLFMGTGNAYYNGEGYGYTTFGSPNWIDYGRVPTGQYTSNQQNANGLSSWKTFDVDQTPNGQNITYQIRVATSAYNLSNTAYTPITSGSGISACSTCTWVQWKANFSTTDNSVSPLLNSASIGWITGDTSLSTVYGLNYHSRYWMAASTSTGNNYNDMLIMSAQPPLNSYTKHDLPISAMVLWNNLPYGAIGNTSKIARLDYGDTDDGAAINSYWTSRDEMFDSPYYYKAMNWGILDYANTPANTNLQIGVSPDMGETYQYRPVNISASTLPRNTKKLNYDANRTLSFRAKIANSVPGIGFKVYGLHLFGKQSGFAGN